MDNQLTSAEKETFLLILSEGMRVLRDNKLGFDSDSSIGTLTERKNWCGSPTCEEYTFHNDAVPNSSFTIKTEDDPLDYSEDRVKAQMVPTEFSARFQVDTNGVSIEEIKKRLDLEDFWIDKKGNKYTSPSGGLPLTPAGTARAYKFRAKATLASRYPVDVQVIYYGDPSNLSDGASPFIGSVILTRDYPYLTPEMRRRKREEQGVGNRPNNSEQPR
ncbi:hypothetical protein [Paraburkholderia bannensis]|uniref:hypothetical protein n=1 Tax=Paraburkholderia bannensis TaxID=765414 RepID=UPI002AC33422|nr:hypothetical protein [Paraburkholderia bannensis]